MGAAPLLALGLSDPAWAGGYITADGDDLVYPRIVALSVVLTSLGFFLLFFEAKPTSAFFGPTKEEAARAAALKKEAEEKLFREQMTAAASVGAVVVGLGGAVYANKMDTPIKTDDELKLSPTEVKLQAKATARNAVLEQQSKVQKESAARQALKLQAAAAEKEAKYADMRKREEDVKKQRAEQQRAELKAQEENDGGSIFESMEAMSQLGVACAAFVFFAKKKKGAKDTREPVVQAIQDEQDSEPVLEHIR